MLREACKQFPGRVVLVHEFRTSQVNSARTNVVAGQAESFSKEGSYRFALIYVALQVAAQNGDAVPDPGPDVLNKQWHQVLRSRRVSRAQHPPHCSRAGPPPRAQQLGGPPNYAQPRQTRPGVGVRAQQRTVAEAAAATPAASIVTCASCHEPNKTNNSIAHYRGDVCEIECA
ncbi:hypothetical protein HaLaN_20874 [Haematococcus lacustris]|uniref:Uncharacterized protein n=1 Tax=Haematococcus lacustris TaxID=44745 RepID=A0A699ZKU3_HAELA|nr:hypothetical protein HaLaN_20874 [Haematococcus lacustris]